MLPEFPSAARNSEQDCDLEYLFSRMNVGSYGPTEPHLWVVGMSPPMYVGRLQIYLREEATYAYVQ